MNEQLRISPSACAGTQDADNLRDDRTHELAPDLAWKRLGIVNVIFFGRAGAGDCGWVLIDAGVHGSAGFIQRAAEDRFGKGARPKAIVMTHGHFDHVGTLERLADEWDVPVFAHRLEFPYLNGEASYPPPDPSVGGGVMAALSRFYPRGPVNVGSRLEALPQGGEIPGMPGWRWLHTPGHTPGHVSLWRLADRLLIAGDAFITTRQESAYAVAAQTPEMHGPPMYYTQDWNEARASVEALAALAPEKVIAGHGPALQGAEMQEALRALAHRFEEVAVPKESRYLRAPAGIGSGREYRAR